MAVELTCHCGQTVTIDPAENLREIRCPRCQSLLPIPTGRDPTETLPGAHLRVIRGPSLVGWHFPLSGPAPLNVGKRRGSHVLLPGAHVSRRHCTLHNHDGIWEVRDEGSRNGTYVNDRRVDSHVLTHGDVLKVGDFYLEVIIPEPPE